MIPRIGRSRNGRQEAGAIPQVYICSRCAEKIDDATQDWVIVSIDSTRGSDLETRVHAECEVKRLKEIQVKNVRPSDDAGRGPRA